MCSECCDVGYSRQGPCVKKIILTKGKMTMVDDEDYEALMTYKWFALGSPGYDGLYAARNGQRGDGERHRTTIRMHRELMGNPTGLMVDHIDHDTLNNQRINLRVVTRSQNGQNQRGQKQKTSSIYKGVSWHKKGKVWYAQIGLNQQSNHLGGFSTEEAAARAYDAAASEYFGEYAYLNFPIAEEEAS